MCHKSNFSFWFTPQRSAISVAEGLQNNDISVKIDSVGSGCEFRSASSGLRVLSYEVE